MSNENIRENNLVEQPLESVQNNIEQIQQREETINNVVEMSNLIENNLVEIGTIDKLNIEQSKDNKFEIKTTNNDEKSSNGVVIQNKLSESLNFLQNYNSDLSSDDEDDEDDSSSEDEDEIVTKHLTFRFNNENSDDSESDTEIDEYDSADEIIYDERSNKGKSISTLKKDDIWLSLDLQESSLELPDISKLDINNREEFKHIGNIECILDKFITIAALPDVPAYDLDTLFFIDEGKKVLGYVVDVMGPVTSPIYVVHLKSEETINLDLKKGTKIYCAPKSKYTKYVFLRELLKIRGSDASWVGDVEVPKEFQDFSDDDEERLSKLKGTKRKRNSLERHKKFEANMNKLNTINTEIQTMSKSKNPFKQPNFNTNLRIPQQMNVQDNQSYFNEHLQQYPIDNFYIPGNINYLSVQYPQQNVSVPEFNPLIPPPIYPTNTNTSTFYQNQPGPSSNH